MRELDGGLGHPLLLAHQLHQALDQAEGRGLLVLAAAHAVHRVPVDLVVAAHVEGGVAVQVARGQLLVAALLPQPVREVAETEPEHAEPHDAPPDLDAALLLVLGHGQHRHPHVDEPEVGQHPQQVHRQHVLLQPHQPHS